MRKPVCANATSLWHQFYLTDSKSDVVLVPYSTPHDAPIRLACKKVGLACYEIIFNSESKRAVVKLVQGEPKPSDTSTTNGKDDVVQPSDIALILHTSGTTGKPKAVPLTHGNLSCSAKNVAESYSLDGSSRGLLLQVLFHIHGIVAGLLAPLVSAGSVVVPDKFDAKTTWFDFAEYHCQWISGTPSALQMLLHAPIPGNLKVGFIRSCSSPLLPTIFQALQKKFSCPIVEAYAMTGTSDSYKEKLVHLD